ncbi:citryl-CoA lyase [Algiphilus sp. W345]|uniref:citrate synthase (unknown stereospecificity) n=1 Tax=Banduia mediterranea TaxID=3075609 RepID=A0ABU2WE74_9GAMM|nr:citryl-CoA lyase [Algiphilus sp. W345]MDT0496177.1 citryl-CoA lyase [Algiphilus sp. W345]
MSRKRRAIVTEMGYSTPDRIVVRGHDLPGELLGRINLGDMAFLEMMGRMPTSGESVLFNALAVTLVEHGLTPSALSARLTFTGAPESIQAAVAAGLSGLGSVFVGTTEDSARLLQEAIPDPHRPPGDLRALAARIVADWHRRGALIPGIGHPLHKPIDPRTPRLFALAAENGFDGPYIALMQSVAAEAAEVYGKVLPINATGAIGACCSELRIPWRACRGIGVFARAVGLVGHIMEEMHTPIARELWTRAEDEAREHALAGGGGG